ncbi:16S rRNA (cytosine(1402)-N(4))-methyltransferase RsmH [Gleimia sp. 6138-11-ORH1]|uniref:16S rRNA (cytosine(1402)-N(4))-methyltransferase RsmH n=1 Tax=Gleimia sp. 6138-11-ORH1 TaxID=2973937 RepID=UPI00216840F8|nr:16S rRNA (cytosine(1402)-N(4))-methyltransferase RsmH [Gleimia sp. 6138-11-ORH1]MCS4484546.1 16S rRNA (cytosine(1402)-N(4))-methyltransferase RsmH [Gleimia sp. 6138-11-ORH1]
MTVKPETTQIDSETIASLHAPVLIDEVLELLSPAFAEVEKAVMIDCTLGMGGHTEAVLKAFPNVSVLGIDRDPNAIALASKRLEPFKERFRAFHTTYDAVYEVAAEVGLAGKIDAVLMDLGVSSLQLDDDERGFAYSRETFLDMRMDPTQGITAAELIATASAEEITRILRTFGEEKFAAKIAKKIVTQRENAPIETSGQLTEIVKAAIPAPARRQGGNPAKRTFQALRVAVNQELDILADAVPAALECLKIGGRLVVESYQSLEDRIVKNVIKEGSEVDIPHGLPIIPKELEPSLKNVTRKAIQANEAQILANPRAASVRLRAAEKLKNYTRPTQIRRKR